MTVVMGEVAFESSARYASKALEGPGMKYSFRSYNKVLYWLSNNLFCTFDAFICQAIYFNYFDKQDFLKKFKSL